MLGVNRRLSKDLSALNRATSGVRNVHMFEAAEDGRTVTFLFDPLSSRTWVTVEVVLSEPRKYPKTAAELRCREDAEVETTLQVLADRTSFALPKLLDDLCDLYGIESGGVFERIQYVEKEGKEEESEEESEEDSDEAVGDGDGEEEEEEEEEEESEYGQDEDDTVDMAEAEDRDLTIACAQRHGRWERQEAAVSAASTAGLSRSRDQRLAEERQIFAPKEAFQMLSNELLAIFRRGQVGERPITADAEGDNVYEWLVRMGHFDPGSQLGKDLQLLKASHGIDTVELRVTFTRGLHPFYPPKVQLIRPRMPVIILSALASHPLLSLELWDPWKPCEKWLSLLKEFLQAHGSVEMGSPMNSPDDFPTSAYSPLERQLASLEAVSGFTPQAAHMDDISDIYDEREASMKEKRRKIKTQAHKKMKTGSSGVFWAAGTGFGTSEHAYDEVWDRQRAMAFQLARDGELESLLAGLAVSLECHMNGAECDQSQACPVSRSPTLEVEAEREIRESCAAFVKHIPVDQIVQSVERSCLLPLLLRELTETTFSDMGERCRYYTASLEVIRQLCSERTARLLTPAGMVHAPGEEPAFVLHHTHSIGAALESLAEEAESFSKVVKTQATNEKLGKSGAPSSDKAPLTYFHMGRTRGLGNGSSGVEEAVIELAERLRDVDAQVECSNFSNEFRTHNYQTDRKAESFNPSSRLVRLGREIAALKSLLPLHPSSSVFVRVDEESSMLWRVLITGPEDTPYSCGCFIFDIYFPSTYPQIAPKVNLQTTGGKSVRFNPNLYKDGKVCLSLLGTWDGHKSETWDSQVSTINQVLVSIQSLIFVPEPFFNEPGYERGMGKAESQEMSKAYNRTIREATLEYAVLAQLKRPYKEFAEAIQKHMKLRKEHLQQQMQGWVEEAEADEVRDHARRLEQLQRQILAILANL